MRKHRKRSANFMNSRWKGGRWSSTRPVRSLKAALAGEAAAAGAIAEEAAVVATAASTMETSAEVDEKNHAGKGTRHKGQVRRRDLSLSLSLSLSLFRSPFNQRPSHLSDSLPDCHT